MGQSWGGSQRTSYFVEEASVSIVWGLAALVACTVVAEYCFRIFVARRIQTVIESVPPLAMIEAPTHQTGRLVTISRGIQARVFKRTPAPLGVIVFCPELDGGSASAPLYCQPLVDSGFAVVGIDLASDFDEVKAIHWSTESEVSKVREVLNYLATTPEFSGLPVGMFGVSRGATVALISACRSKMVKSVLTDSGYSSMGLTRNFVSRFGRQIVPDWLFDRLPDWHIDKALWKAFDFSERSRGCSYVHVEHECQSLSQPVMLISGRRDSYVTPNVTTSLADLLNVSEAPWFVPKAKHNKARIQAPEEYAEVIVDHFIKTLVESRATDGSIESRRASVA